MCSTVYIEVHIWNEKIAQSCGKLRACGVENDKRFVSTIASLIQGNVHVQRKFDFFFSFASDFFVWVAKNLASSRPECE